LNAYREAGRALLARHFGLAVHEIAVSDDAMRGHPEHALAADPDVAATLILGSVAAEKISNLWMPSQEELRIGHQDERDAAELVPDPARRSKLFLTAYGVLQANQDQLDALAIELHERGRLSGLEVDRVIAAAGRGRRSTDGRPTTVD
jgi:hypothetical protein